MNHLSLIRTNTIAVINTIAVVIASAMAGHAAAQDPAATS